MKLHTYLAENKITYSAFAETIKVSNAKVVERYCKGTRFPRPGIIQKITTATDGKVTANDFMPALAAE